MKTRHLRTDELHEADTWQERMEFAIDTGDGAEEFNQINEEVLRAGQVVVRVLSDSDHRAYGFGFLTKETVTIDGEEERIVSSTYGSFPVEGVEIDDPVSPEVSMMVMRLEATDHAVFDRRKSRKNAKATYKSQPSLRTAAFRVAYGAGVLVGDNTIQQHFTDGMPSSEISTDEIDFSSPNCYARIESLKQFVRDIASIAELANIDLAYRDPEPTLSERLKLFWADVVKDFQANR